MPDAADRIQTIKCLFNAWKRLVKAEIGYDYSTSEDEHPPKPGGFPDAEHIFQKQLSPSNSMSDAADGGNVIKRLFKD
jgi:hypothetical protein